MRTLPRPRTLAQPCYSSSHREGTVRMAVRPPLMLLRLGGRWGIHAQLTLEEAIMRSDSRSWYARTMTDSRGGSVVCARCFCYRQPLAVAWQP